jgi:L,D-peptidoglycan transpeptidase YkuD (ErfK/YbiS/YcfS/YnhG family)
MDLIVTAKPGETRGSATLGELSFPCALGRSGILDPKREGDGGTPAGRFPFRRLLYRADRIPRIETRLPAAHIDPTDGWCDDPAAPDYNRPVTLPHPARHERLWLASPLYDLVVVIGHNDDPVVPGAGSAVFLHVAREDWGPTEGCVAFRPGDLLRILEIISPTDFIAIRAG